MIDAEAFVEAKPRDVAAALGDAVHLWRLPWRRDQGRGPLLELLAYYLQVDSSTLKLEENEHGKPSLQGARGLHFNWSHSGEIALVALARDFELGVDVECARAGVQVVELAQRFFAPAEAEALIACDEREREDSFLQLWCAKEAVLKALGRGLAFGLERVEFAFSQPGWRPFRFEAEAGSAADWQVLPLRPAPDCAGALAWRGPPRPLRTWTLAEAAFP